MKALYILTIDMGSEDSVYFTSMTESQARELKGMLRGYSIPHTLQKVTSSSGYNSLSDIIRLVQDLGNG